MRHGDFSQLAEKYINRPGYSQLVLDILYDYVRKGRDHITIVEVGAGTGKLTSQLTAMGLSCIAVEPNDKMRREGEKATRSQPVKWLKGLAESTGLADNLCEWAIMASSFHWTNPSKSLPELHRIIKDDGYFTVMWNPRDLERSKFHQELENRIYEIAPNIKRKSSGGKRHLNNIETVLTDSGHFTSPLHIEAPHNEIMSRQRYLGAWDSVNDIQVQAGKDGWEKIRQMLEQSTRGLERIDVPYRTRSWTVSKAVSKII
ncbi:MAG TPA: class I SAM-dependent methyltransferase [Desulfobacterales bacterium]|nr:class I SAM-dependent methyltransferase [Desulfobacterales bacterium]